MEYVVGEETTRASYGAVEDARRRGEGRWGTQDAEQVDHVGLVGRLVQGDGETIRRHAAQVDVSVGGAGEDGVDGFVVFAAQTQGIEITGVLRLETGRRRPGGERRRQGMDALGYTAQNES